MAKERKIQVRKVETKELQRKCENCEYFIKFSDTIGICRYKSKIMLANFNCAMWTEGEPRTATIDDIAYWYEWTKLELEAMKRQLDILRDIIINEIGTENYTVVNTNYFVIKVSKVKTKRLQTNRVKEFLEKIGKLDEFLTESEHYRVEVKRIGVRM